MQLESDKIELTEKVQTACKALKKQQTEIVLPVIEEVTKREIENQKLLSEVKDRTINLKILFAMIRSPKMCDLLHKTERRRFTQEKLEELTQQSVFLLRQYQMDHKNGEHFVESVYDQVTNQVKNDYRERSP